MELHNYIESLIKPIQSQEVKLAVAEEIKGHIEEQKEAYMEEGMDEKAALEQAILSMGSPKEVGDAFATIYNLTSEKKKYDLLFYIFTVRSRFDLVPENIRYIHGYDKNSRSNINVGRSYRSGI